MRRAVLSALLLLLSVPAADAATRQVVRGAGNGHGVGMSQYGAYGYALHGRDYRAILRHYYRGTAIASARIGRVRVLLQAGRSAVRFRGASRLAGVRNLDRRATYRVAPSRGRLGLYKGRRLVGRYGGLRVYRAGGSLTLVGSTINGIRDGRFRGSLDLVRSGGGVTAVDRITIDDYVRGVVAGEMPSSWHPEALKAQAVAARSYALTTRGGGGLFDLYPDTRSQVYLGVAGETAATNRAVRATARQVVTYGGQPVATYYFSASGGHTENVENSFLGADPKPWLKGVDDPYDVISPRHRWRVSFSTAQIDARLGSYSPGRFRKIVVLRRGVSPRIVRARVYGTQGTREISGPTLRSRLGLYDTWAYFNTVSTSQVGSPTAFSARLGDVFPRRRIRGSFAPAPRGRLLTLERRAGSAWVRVKAVRTSASGRYTAVVPASGVYRVRAGDVAGPAVRVR